MQALAPPETRLTRYSIHARDGVVVAVPTGDVTRTHPDDWWCQSTEVAALEAQLQQVEAQRTAREQALQHLVDEARRTVNQLLGFNEQEQVWFCTRCRPEKDSERLHAPGCFVYDLHAAFDNVESSRKE